MNKKKLTLSVDEGVVKKAKDLNINISQVTEDVLSEITKKDSNYKVIQIYESNHRLKIIPDERPNVVKVSIQKIDWNYKGSLTRPKYKTIKSYRITRMQSKQYLESVMLLTKSHVGEKHSE